MKAKLALLATALVLAVIVVEVGARIARPAYSDDTEYLRQFAIRVINSGVGVGRGSDHYDPHLGYRLTPSTSRAISSAEVNYTVRTNSLGFRGREIAPGRSGEYRLMLLGDSMFWGVGCSETETIDARLEQLSSGKLLAFNFSTPGYNTLQELLVARAYLGEVRPDHVVLGLFVGNDPLATWLSEVDGAGNYAVSEPRLERLNGELRAMLSPLAWHSSALRMAAAELWAPRLRYELIARDEVVERTRELLGEISALCASFEARLSVVVIYPADAVAGGALGRWTGSGSAGERYVRACQEQGIEVLDTLQPMRGGQLYYPRDGHLNPAGTELLARIVHERLIAPRL